MRFTVEQALKDINTPEVEILTVKASSESYYPFKQGQRYLVYAYRLADNRGLRASGCTRTRPLDKGADDEVECLRNLAQANPQGRIFGAVYRLARDFEQGFGSRFAGAMSGMTVIVEGQNKRFELTTDNEGRYRVVGVAPGNYKVEALLPDHLGGRLSHEVYVPARECVEMYFEAREKGSISGQVLDSLGRAVPNVAVTIMPADRVGTEKSSYPGMWEYTDDNGRYEFEGVSAGRYLIGVNISFAPDADDPYPPTYYPGVSDVAQAKVISLDDRQQLINHNIHLAPRLKSQFIRGRVQWPDGRPVVNAVITLVDMEYPWEPIAGKDESDAQGYFTVTGFKNRRYKIYAYTPADGVHEQLPAEPVIVDASRPVRLVKLVIKTQSNTPRRSIEQKNAP